MGVFAVILIICGGVFISVGLVALADGALEGILIALGSIVMLVAGFGILVYSPDSSADIQQAADTQGIEVVIDGSHITTKAPCSLQLDFQNNQLVMSGTNSVVTVDKLESLCAILAK